MMSDLPPGWAEGVRDFIDTFPRTLNEIDSLLTTNAIYQGRTMNIGVIGPEDAIDCGFTGPNLRASGIDYDIRKDRPYYDYETYDFEVPGRGERGLLRPLSGAHGGDAPERVHPAPGAWSASPAVPSTWKTRASACPARLTA